MEAGKGTAPTEALAAAEMPPVRTSLVVAFDARPRESEPTSL